MAEMPGSSWIERLLLRLRRRAMPPRLLDGYTRRVMERLAPPAPSVRLVWGRPWRWVAAPAAAVAVGVVIWVSVGGRATPLSSRTLAQAVVLDRLDESWPADAVDASLLVEDAQQVDRFVLAQAPSAAAASAESLADLLHQLDEEPLDPADDTLDDGLSDPADPTPA